MLSPLGVLRWCDAQIQYLVDWLAYAAMRRWELTKYELRWRLWAAYTVLMWVSPFLPPIRSLVEFVAACILSFLLLMAGVGVTRVVDEFDHRAEITGMRSIADKASLLWKAFGIFFLMSSHADSAASYACEIAIGALTIFQGYLCNTDPTPPPKKETAPALQPETA